MAELQEEIRNAIQRYYRVVPPDTHLVEGGGSEERRTLAFCDYLRNHFDSAREYEKLKRDLAACFGAIDPDCHEEYARAKTDFIERVVAAAFRDGYPVNQH